MDDDQTNVNTIKGHDTLDATTCLTKFVFVKTISSYFATACHPTASPTTNPAMNAGIHPGGCTDRREADLVSRHTLLL